MPQLMPQLRSQLSGQRTDRHLLSLRAIAVLLVLAPVCDVTESALSPLTNTSTAADVAAIGAHQTRFAVSVLVGALGTTLFLLALLGLMSLTVARAPRLSRIGAGFVTICMLGWMGVRMGQAFELEGVRSGLPHQVTGRLVDHAMTNPIGGVLLAAFLLGNVLGMLAVAAAVWRAGLPRPAAVLLLVFPFADLALESSVGSVPAHLLLLVALAWIAGALLKDAAPGRLPVPAPAVRAGAA